MGTFLFFILKSSVCLFLFTILYITLLKNITHFRFSRWAFWVGTLFCWLIPLIPVSVSILSPIQQSVMMVGEIFEEIPSDGKVATGFLTENGWDARAEHLPFQQGKSEGIYGLSLLTVISLFYTMGAVGVFLFFVYSFGRLWHLIHGKPVQREGSFRLVILPGKVCSFSWWKYIVMSEEDYRQDGSLILIHEKKHLSYYHTLDLGWMHCLLIFHWFNPMTWVLWQELRDLHEYEADEGVISSGVNMVQYQLLLVKKAVGTRLYSMACGFNHSKLKNRITMMLKRRTNNWARLKLLLFVPVAAGTLYAFARPEVKKTMGQEINTPVSVKQNSVQESELQQLEAFFERKAEDAVGGKKEYQIENPTGTFYSFFVNMNNKMMLNQELIKEYDVETLSVRLKDLLRKEYRKVANTDKKWIPGLFVRYDRGSSSTAITSYLRTIKEAYLQVRGEISKELGGVSEARLDSLLPIFVSFGEPKVYSSKYKTASDVFLPIEVSLYPRGGISAVIKNPSLQELELKLKDYKTIANSVGLSVGLKFDKDVTMGIVQDVKEVIRKTLSDK